jgi:hypothetical protein
MLATGFETSLLGVLYASGSVVSVGWTRDDVAPVGVGSDDGRRWERGRGRGRDGT